MSRADYDYIDDAAGLERLIAGFAGADCIALDTEFVRESTYYPELALIQVASDQCLACIDPLAVDDLTPLGRLLSDPGLLKVFHSPAQDLEILYLRLGQVPAPVFDTQLAAAVLGYDHQASYADLVSDIAGVRLEKKHTRANWLRRPLSTDELDYALDDVRYLLALYRELDRRLADSGRRGWIEADLRALSDPAKYRVDDDDLWRRLRGVQKLKGVRLQIASDLCRWREAEARRRNRPRRWIVKDEVLVDIARRQPDSLAELERVPDLAGRTLQRHGKTLLDIVARALATAPDDWPCHDRRATPSAQQLALGDCLMALCRQLADDNQIALATLATRKDIDNLVMDRKSSRLAQGWRFAMAGEKLLAFIHGQSALAVDGERLRLIEKEPGN